MSMPYETRYDPLRHDPVQVAHTMRWARMHYRDDPTQPRDLGDFMLRAAETLEHCVPKHWRVIAVIEAIVLVSLPFWCG